MAKASVSYDCKACHAYCCSYPIIEARPADRARLAKHFKITAKDFLERYTVSELYGRKRVRVLKHSPDPVLGGSSCMFLNKRTRRCMVYKVKPQICTDHPGDERCEWFDRLTIETLRSPRRKVIRLVQMPSELDGDRPLYEGENLGELLNSYAHGDGSWPPPRRKAKASRA